MRNFANGIAELNKKTGRHSVVYANGQSELYAGPVHLGIIGEDGSLHSQHMASFAQNPPSLRGIYSGAAGFVNMGYIANGRFGAALLFDINAYQTLFWNLIFAKVAECEHPRSFRQSLSSIVTEVQAAAAEKFPVRLRDIFKEQCALSGGPAFKGLREEEVISWVRAETSNSPDRKWMYDDRLYAHIRGLVAENSIGAITLDITSEKACDAVSDYLKQRDVYVHTLYTSNILNFMQPYMRKRDFIGREVFENTREKAQNNLYPWLQPDGRIIECDNLKSGRPLMISAEAFSPERLCL